MSHLSKRKIALAFAACAIIAAIAAVGIFTVKIYKVDKAEAQSAIECLPIKGSTTAFLVSGIADSGTIDFDNPYNTETISVGGKKYYSGVNIGANHKACAEKWTDANGNFKGYKLKGWEWNNNLGLVSFYCDSSGVNRDWYCTGGTYGVEIDINGNSKGQIYVNNIGLVNFTGTNINGVAHVSKATYPADPAADRTINAGNGWTWSDRVGWMNFSGTKWQGSGAAGSGCSTDNDGDGYIAIGCPGNDCDDNNPNVNPGAKEICGNGIDENCDGVDDNCGGCIVDNDKDGFCKEDPGECGDDDSAIYPGAPELCDGKDNNCNGTIDEGCLADDSAFKCGAASITGNVKAQSGGPASTFFANREVIARNVEKAKNMLGGIKCGWDSDAKNIYYCEDSPRRLKEIVVGITVNDKSRTVIIVGGDIYIDQDYYGGGTQLGVISLKSDSGNGGNVYIGNNVKKLQAHIFADGGVYSYDQSSGVKYSPDKGPLTPPSDYITNFWKQLLIEGSITSHDNDDTDLKTDAPLNKYPYNSFKCLRPTKINPETEAVIPITKIPGETSDKSVIIKYQPPLKNLPVFGGISGAGTQQVN